LERKARKVSLKKLQKVGKKKPNPKREGIRRAPGKKRQI